MADDNLLSEAEQEIQSANSGNGGMFGGLITGAENMLKEKTGIDLASMLGGGQQAAPAAQDSSQTTDNSSN